MIVSVCCSLAWVQLACLYRLTAEMEVREVDGHNPEGLTWITSYGLDPEDVQSCYITAMYWSIMTVTTIGYGDVPAQTDTERAVVAVCMIVGAGMFAYVVGSICGIIAGMNKETTE